VVVPTSTDWIGQRSTAERPRSGRLRRLRHPRLRLGAWLLSTAVLFAVAWWLVAPPQLGGKTSLVVVDGTSMLPRLERDDLVALRASSSYRVGDVVGYRSRLLHRVVLHRVVGVDAGRFTFEGDNNGYLDPEHPAADQLIGKLWLRIPAAGRVVPLLHVSWIVGPLAALLVLALGLGSGARPESSNVDPF
jgi:signal peptidase I